MWPLYIKEYFARQEQAFLSTAQAFSLFYNEDQVTNPAEVFINHGIQWNIKNQLSSYNTLHFLPCKQLVLDACIPDDDHYSLHQLFERRGDLVKTGFI